MTDDVLREVRQAREAFARSHGYDVRAMVAALHRLNEAGDRPVVSLPPRPAKVRPAPADSPVAGERQVQAAGAVA